jgi:hypothetical protein
LNASTARIALAKRLDREQGVHPFVEDATAVGSAEFAMTRPQDPQAHRVSGHCYVRSEPDALMLALQDIVRSLDIGDTPPAKPKYANNPSPRLLALNRSLIERSRAPGPYSCLETMSYTWPITATSGPTRPTAARKLRHPCIRTTAVQRAKFADRVRTFGRGQRTSCGRVDSRRARACGRHEPSASRNVDRHESFALSATLVARVLR